MVKNKLNHTFGDPEIICERPISIEQIVEPRGETAKLVALSKSNSKKYEREVLKPFFVDADGLTTLNGNPARRASIVLKAPGCAKRRGFSASKSYPNCPFCVFSENFSTGGNTVTPAQYENQMLEAMKTLAGEMPEIDIIEIYNSGSFFSNSEICPAARKKIIDIVRAHTPKDITITLESKISDLASLDQLTPVLNRLNSDGGSRKLEIAFGLETLDQTFGKEMKKGTDPKTLEKMIKKLAKLGVRSFFYVLLKPGLMSEKNAILTSIETVKRVALISKKLILPDELKPHLSLAPTRIYLNSLLHSYKSYKAPKYWSVAEAVKSLAEESLGDNDTAFDYVGMHIGLSGEGIPIVKGGSPKTGSKFCHKKLEKIFRDFNHKMDIDKFLADYDALTDHDNLSCGCFHAWQLELEAIPVETINTTDKVIQAKQLDEVMAAEKAAWPKEVRAPLAKFKSRAKIFPDGFFLGYESGIVAGVSTSQISNFEPHIGIKSWETITNNGLINPVQSGRSVNGHNPDGNAIYVVSLGVRKSFKGRGIGGALLGAQKELVKSHNLRYLFLGSRVPCFAEAKKMNPKLTIGRFVHQKDRAGRLLDDDIRFYAKHGLKIAQIKENYMEDDPESLNFGVIMYWENPGYCKGN